VLCCVVGSWWRDDNEEGKVAFRSLSATGIRRSETGLCQSIACQYCPLQYSCISLAPSLVSMQRCAHTLVHQQIPHDNDSTGSAISFECCITLTPHTLNVVKPQKISPLIRPYGPILLHVSAQRCLWGHARTIALHFAFVVPIKQWKRCCIIVGDMCRVMHGQERQTEIDD
jgi:hypothetical protein